MKCIIILFAVIIGFQNSISEEGDYTVIVKLTNLKSDKGKLSVSIYDDPETFPKSTGMLEQKIIEGFTEGEFIITFTGLKPGTYAVAGLHDENGDDKMNFNLIGFPKEGYCFSNNIMPKFRAARWNESKFLLEKTGMQIELEMKY